MKKTRKTTEATDPQALYPDPPHVRRAMAEAYRKRAAESRWTPAERAEFARMADAWAKTLPQKKV